jgi:GT2 family glycosyltransferase
LSPGPAVSVVVATHDRPQRLAALLDALGEQQLEAQQSFEVIVVDDGSGPATAALLAERARGRPRGLRVIRNARPRGPGAARNAGWRGATAPLIAFTDDDCVPESGWLEAGLRAHRETPGAIVQGTTRPNPHEGSAAGLFSRTLTVQALGPNYETCNVFYPRELLERLGGFEEGFGLRPGGEDTDLAWRALALGRPATLAPEAVVLHAVERLGPLGSLRVAARWSETMRIFARHRPLRRTLYRGIFWNVWHYLLVRSLVSLALPRPLRRLRALVLARHVLALRRRARAAGAGSWAVPYLLLHDIVELSAVLRGALRHRTLVL